MTIRRSSTVSGILLGCGLLGLTAGGCSGPPPASATITGTAGPCQGAPPLPGDARTSPQSITVAVTSADGKLVADQRVSYPYSFAFRVSAAAYTVSAAGQGDGSRSVVTQAGRTTDASLLTACK